MKLRTDVLLKARVSILFTLVPYELRIFCPVPFASQCFDCFCKQKFILSMDTGLLWLHSISILVMQKSHSDHFPHICLLAVALFQQDSLEEILLFFSGFDYCK